MKCEVDDCPNPSRAKRGGMCNLHRMRARNGTPMSGLNSKSDWAEKFLAYMNAGSPDECWEWTGPLNGTGYGAINIARAHWTAHRLSYALHNGVLPDGAFICHHCDNPPCVNPAHLYAGTPADNVRDREQRARRPILKGEQVGRARLTEDSVRRIRALVSAGKRQADIADQFGVSKSLISHVATRRSWRHVA